MQMDLFILLLGFFFAFFTMAFATKKHEIGIISGLYLLVLGITSYVDPLTYKTGETTIDGVMTYTQTTISSSWIGLIGLTLVGISILILYQEAKAIWGK